jgi:hypothetical protein
LTSFKGKHGFYKIRKSAHFLQFRLWNLETPSNGIVSFSPRLPRFVGATLGCTLGNGNNANGVVAEVMGARERNGRNRVAVGEVWGW